jgi:hypothetical protein
MALLLDVWREACRHSDISESVERIARLLTQRLPADVLLVRRLDLGKKRLETLATGLCRGARAPRQARTSVSPADIPDVLSWLRAAEPAVGKVSDRPLSLLVSEEGPADAIAVPLPAADNEILIVLVLLSYPPRSFTSEHSAIALQLVEPLTVALQPRASASWDSCAKRWRPTNGRCSHAWSGTISQKPSLVRKQASAECSSA